jgi:hypothetical protein
MIVQGSLLCLASCIVFLLLSSRCLPTAFHRYNDMRGIPQTPTLCYFQSSAPFQVAPRPPRPPRPPPNSGPPGLYSTTFLRSDQLDHQTFDPVFQLPYLRHEVTRFLLLVVSKYRVYQKEELTFVVTEAAMTALDTPHALPSATLLGTYTYGTFLSSQRRGR